MKIAVIGNCQVRTIGACLRVLLPNAEVHDLWLVPQQQEAVEVIRDSIESFDVVCMHRADSGPFAYDIIRGQVDRVLLMPALVFNGFHPDDIVIAAAVGPLGHNHSAIVVSSYLLGLSVERCTKLFNAFIYASLGYFERFGQAKQFLLRSAAAYELPLDEHFPCWDTPFMYDVNHPKLGPLASLAEVLASRITGRHMRAAWAATGVPATFEEKPFVSWPVYPEIARQFRIAPDDMRFRYPHTSPGLDVRQFIQRSYDVYANIERAILETAAQVEHPILQELVRQGSR